MSILLSFNLSINLFQKYKHAFTPYFYIIFNVRIVPLYTYCNNHAIYVLLSILLRTLFPVSFIPYVPASKSIFILKTLSTSKNRLVLIRFISMGSFFVCNLTYPSIHWQCHWHTATLYLSNVSLSFTCKKNATRPLKQRK